MILEALRRRVVRYFRPPATSLSPQISEDAIIDRMIERGLIEPAWTSAPKESPAVDVGEVTAAGEALRIPVRHSPPDLDWPAWCRMVKENERQGWVMCRYPVRAAPPSAALGFVYGVVRSAFGIHEMHFYLCNPVNRIQSLWAITHLRSGFGCGLFVTQALAAEAAEIALRISDDWSMFDPEAVVDAEANAVVARAHHAWMAAGITLGPVHAHVIADTRTPEIGVWIRAEDEARPEKLS